MKTLVYNIGQLWLAMPGEQPLGGVEMSALTPLEKAWFRFEDGLITEIGQGDLPLAQPHEIRVNCEGGLVFPGFCDSHTHLVFADWRPEEFLQKMKSNPSYLLRFGLTNSSLNDLSYQLDFMFSNPLISFPEVKLDRYQSFLSFGEQQNSAMLLDKNDLPLILSAPSFL